MTKIVPDPEDFEAVERELGAAPNATEAEQARRYRLAQAKKLLRMHPAAETASVTVKLQAR